MSTTLLPADRAQRLRATGLAVHRGGAELLAGVSVDIASGELVALIGPSGAGKTTLLRALGGLNRPSRGGVRLDGADVVADERARRRIGYVPQDDIIHRDLPLRRTLAYAARLRLVGISRAEREAAIDQVLEDLDLAGQATVRVRDLSGGQRKRASAAVELLTRPDVLLLDEPTSGLDPATAAEVLRALRRLTEAGATVVLTTHAPADVQRCDRVVVLGHGGRVRADRAGSPSNAPRRIRRGDRGLGSPLAQLATLAQRSADLMLRNRLTAAILVGAPLLVIGMLAKLVYWIAFAGFFFGLTYGLLQIVTESSIVRRERSWGLSMAAYVGAKLLVLLPLLLAVDVTLFTVLRLLDRLPSLPADAWLGPGVAFLLDAVAGLALGLLASAVVSNASQATLALPMLCFPQVLFAGAMIPVDVMAEGGRAISVVMSNRWSFEALGRILELTDRYVGSPDPLGDWVTAFQGTAIVPVMALAAMSTLCLTATIAVLRHRTNPR